MSAGSALHLKSVPQVVGSGEAPIARGILLNGEIENGGLDHS